MIYDSIKTGEKVFRILIYEHPLDWFFRDRWEQRSTKFWDAERSQLNSHKKCFSQTGLFNALLQQHVDFTNNIEIIDNVKFCEVDIVGRALPKRLLSYIEDGLTARFSSPETLVPVIHGLSSWLQEYFHCRVKTNAYLMPPKKRSSPPHYDNFDMFVFQIEGRNRWRLYKPRNSAHMLPWDPSPNFSEAEIELIRDEELVPNQVLYIPRGTIYQYFSGQNNSLHFTLSLYQRPSYADLFGIMIIRMVHRAIANIVDLRRRLPLHTWRNAGIAFNNINTPERSDMLQEVTRLFEQMLKSESIADLMDAAVDQLAEKYQHEALPPQLSNFEKARTEFEKHVEIHDNVICPDDYKINLRTNVRLLRANIMSLVEEENWHVYSHATNSLKLCKDLKPPIKFDNEDAYGIYTLIRAYPEYIGVYQLPLLSEKRKVKLVTTLLQNGSLMLEKP